MSGKTKEYLFSPSESAGDIAQFVFDNWPPEWEEESVSNALEYLNVGNWYLGILFILSDVRR